MPDTDPLAEALPCQWPLEDGCRDGCDNCRALNVVRAYVATIEARAEAAAAKVARVEALANDSSLSWQEACSEISALLADPGTTDA